MDEENQSDGEAAASPEPKPILLYFTELRKGYKCVVADCRKPIVKEYHLGNMKRHLRRHHRASYRDYLKEETAYKAILEKRKQEKRSKKKKSSLMSAASIKEKLVRLVAVRGRPLKLMDDPEFQALTMPLVNQLPTEEKFAVNSENVRSFTEIEAANVRETVANELKGRMVSLKIDSASRGARPFFAINAQFIDKKALQIRTLKVKEMLTEQTAAHVKTEIVLTTAEYQVPTGNIYTVTCDNGANMILASHLITEEQEKEAAQEESDADEDMFDCQALNQEEWEAGCCASVDNTCQCLRCAAHTLQLAIEHALKNCQAAQATLAKVRAAVNTLRNPSSRRLLTKVKLSVPTLDNATRWNTKYTMLVSLQNLKIFLTNEDYVGPAINVDWDEVAELIAALEPVKEATVKLQSEQLLLGDFLFVWLACKEKLAKQGSTLATDISNEMDKMSAQVLYKSGPRSGSEHWPSLMDHPVILAAIFMDPRIFTYLNASQVEVAKKHLAGLWEKLEANNRRATEDETEEDGEDTNGDEDDKSSLSSDDEEESEFMKNLKEKDSTRSRAIPSRVNITTKLEQYYRETKMLKKKSDVLEFWDDRKKTHPELYQLSCVALAVPATQVSVERLFSALKFLLDPLRMAMKSSFVDDLLVIRSNVLQMEKENPRKRKRKSTASSSSSGSTFSS